MRQLNLGHGTSSQSEPIVHFGVGRAAGPFQVEVRWPSGEVSRVQVDAGLTRVREPAGPGAGQRRISQYDFARSVSG